MLRTFFIGAFLFLCCFHVQAATFVVTKTADTNDGACNADCSLREAIAAANSSDQAEINFDASAFATPQTILLGSGLILSRSMNIKGPKAGVTLQEKSQQASLTLLKVAERTNLSDLTINYGAVGVENSGTLQVDQCIIGPNITGIKNIGTAIISNSLVKGNSIGIADDIKASSSTNLTANHCSFSDNRSAATCSNGSMTFFDCILTGNTHYALSCSGVAKLDVQQCDFDGNELAVFSSLGTTVISNCTISNGKQAGMIIYGGNVNVSGCLFKGNGDNAILNMTRGTVVTNCTFKDESTQTLTNRTRYGILNRSGGTISCHGCSFYNIGYGLINQSEGNVKAVNCTFVNIVDAILNGVGTLEISHCTVVGNSGGIYSSDGPTTISNSIVADNIYSDGTVNNINGVITDSGHNVIGGTAAEAGLEVDSGGKPILKDNGGPTYTVALVKSGSALNGCGTNNFSEIDQRGVARPQGRAADIGAYEAVEAPIGDVTVVEADSVTTRAIFPVTLSAPLPIDFSVTYATADGSAKAGTDYRGSTGTLTIPAGQTSAAIEVPIANDAISEGSEVFYLLLSNPINGILGKGRGVGTIADDDPLPAFSVKDIIINEGNSGTRNANFVVRLNAPSSQVVSVDVSSADATAKAGTDYQTLPLTTLRFSPSQTERTVTVFVNGDVLDEASETFKVNLSNPQNARLGDAVAVGTIIDDDNSPALTIADVSVAEGQIGTKYLRFTVNLSAPSGQTIKVNYVTADGSARASSDYSRVAGTLEFPAGQTSKTISVPIVGDVVAEDDEIFYIVLSEAVRASVSRGRAISTILNDDASAAAFSPVAVSN